MPTDAVATPNSWDEWTTDQLDLHAYLNRIGHTGPLTADATTLAALHRAHVAAIPFENLDVILGRGISVALPDVQRKLVEARRGGYCYEHGLLFAAVATRLGFTAQRLLARVGDLERPRPRTHLVTLLTDPGGEAWLADPGFGSGLLTALPLRADAEATQGAWTYRLRRLDGGRWQLQEAAAGEAWQPLYAFEIAVHHAVDVEMSNHYTSTWPGSPFVHRPVVVRKDERAVRRLVGSQLTVVRPGRPDEVRDVEASELGAVLRDLGIDLTPDEVGLLESPAPGAGPGRPARP
jgi:N-hydroxyarylamine O-acetyltransferase